MARDDDSSMIVEKTGVLPTSSSLDDDDDTLTDNASKTIRTSLNGSWILDKSQPYSMKEYLSIMHVDELAILAHEKGEEEFDTICTIELNDTHVTLYKLSRVNNNLCVQLRLGEETVELLKPENRPKKQLATSDGPTHLLITSSLKTVNGLATVKDEKHLDEDGSRMVQTLTITNEQSKENSVTTRYFLPYNDIPPHLKEAEQPEEQP